MQRYKLIRYIKKTFLVIMAKEIKINKRLIIDGKEQGCDLLKIHYLCGDKDNSRSMVQSLSTVVICSKFITFAVTKTTSVNLPSFSSSCDLLKIHYLCGDKDNKFHNYSLLEGVVICSKFITFAVTKTTLREL